MLPLENRKDSLYNIFHMNTYKYQKQEIDFLNDLLFHNMSQTVEQDEYVWLLLSESCRLVWGSSNEIPNGPVRAAWKGYRVGADGNLNRYQPGRYVGLVAIIVRFSDMQRGYKVFERVGARPEGHGSKWVVPQKLWM